MLLNIFVVLMLVMPLAAFSQAPPIGPGVSHDLAIWRAAHYSDVRYKLTRTPETMSPVRGGGGAAGGGAGGGGGGGRGGE